MAPARPEDLVPELVDGEPRDALVRAASLVGALKSLIGTRRPPPLWHSTVPHTDCVCASTVNRWTCRRRGARPRRTRAAPASTRTSWTCPRCRPKRWSALASAARPTRRRQAKPRPRPPKRQRPPCRASWTGAHQPAVCRRVVAPAGTPRGSHGDACAPMRPRATCSQSGGAGGGRV